MERHTIVRTSDGFDFLYPVETGFGHHPTGPSHWLLRENTLKPRNLVLWVAPTQLASSSTGSLPGRRTLRRHTRRVSPRIISSRLCTSRIGSAAMQGLSMVGIVWLPTQIPAMHRQILLPSTTLNSATGIRT